MRNREQIYGQEAARLLRNITVYHCIRHDQLLRLYPGKEGVIENIWSGSSGYSITLTGIAMETSPTAARIRS